MQGKEKSFSLRMSATLVYGVWLTYTIDQWSMVYGGAEVLGKTGERDKISSKLFCVGRSKFSLEVQPRYLPAERDGSKMGRVTLYNKSNNTVVVDYTISANGGESALWKDVKIKDGLRCDVDIHERQGGSQHEREGYFEVGRCSWRNGPQQ